MEGGPPSFPQGSSCPVVLRNTPRFSHPVAYGALTLSGGPFQAPSARMLLHLFRNGSRRCRVLQPPDGIGLPSTQPSGFGPNPFRSPLLRASRLISLPRGTKMFQFPRFPPTCLWIQQGVTVHDDGGVLPFGHPRLSLLDSSPGLFAVVPRPSSAPNAKASTVSLRHLSSALLHSSSRGLGSTLMHVAFVFCLNVFVRPALLPPPTPYRTAARSHHPSVHPPAHAREYTPTSRKDRPRATPQTAYPCFFPFLIPSSLGKVQMSTPGTNPTTTGLAPKRRQGESPLAPGEWQGR